MALFVVAVTGGVASGKSAVTGDFSELGIHIADADIAAREVVMPNQPALAEIVSAFGTQILENGILNRQALRQKIFNDPVAKKKLEAILHPRIRIKLQAQCESATSNYAIVAIPLLAEVAGKLAYPWLDKILVVDTTREKQYQRLLQRDQITEKLARQMLDAQATRSERLAIADDVISNMHDLLSLKQTVQRLDKRYQKLALLQKTKSGIKTD
jgi:dephospho-CoA kinase